MLSELNIYLLRLTRGKPGIQEEGDGRCGALGGVGIR